MRKECASSRNYNKKKKEFAGQQFGDQKHDAVLSRSCLSRVVAFKREQKIDSTPFAAG